MHFGYVPGGKIVGLSKIPRLIQAMASRPIVQEDLVSEIADTFMSVVKPLGCVVRTTGRHDCVAVRGVKCHEAQMTTVAGPFPRKAISCGRVSPGLNKDRQVTYSLKEFSFQEGEIPCRIHVW
jgi:GTP cyclohydrolase I